MSDQTEAIEKTIIRSMNEGVITLECNGAIYSMNPSAERILQIQEEPVKGRSYEEVFFQPENHDFSLIMHDLIRNGRPTLNREIVYLRNDGQKVDLSVAGAFLEVDECTPGTQNAMVVFRDVTAFKSLERVKRKAVDHLSHELKTPLAIIAASVEQLGREDLPKQKREGNLTRVKRNLARLTAIQEAVEEILTPVQVFPALIDAPSFFKEVLNEIRGKASHRLVTFTTRIEPIQTQVLDPAILRMVVDTLVKNAVENTPDGGEILISFGKTPAGLLLEVEDFGIGIPVSDLEFIFEGFHHTQETDEYSSKKPFDFNAGGKGLELLRLKILAEEGLFKISFRSRRCEYVPAGGDCCSGLISSCPHVDETQLCRDSGGTAFSVLFHF